MIHIEQFKNQKIYVIFACSASLLKGSKMILNAVFDFDYEAFYDLCFKHPCTNRNCLLYNKEIIYKHALNLKTQFQKMSYLFNIISAITEVVFNDFLYY